MFKLSQFFNLSFGFLLILLFVAITASGCAPRNCHNHYSNTCANAAKLKHHIYSDHAKRFDPVANIIEGA